MSRGHRRPGLLALALGAVAIVAVVLAVTAVGSSTTTPTQATRTVTVGRGVVQSTVSGSGNLAPLKQADLNFSTSGELTHLYVSVGRHVVTGQLLAQLDPSTQQVALAQAQASVQSAQDALDGAQTAATEAATAATTEATTPTTATAPAATRPAAATTSGASTLSVEAATADLESAQLSVTSAQNALDATKLFAPMPGTVTSIDGALGDTVGSSASTGAASSSSSATSSGPTVARGLGGSDASSSGSGSTSSSSALIVLSQLSRLTLDVSLTESDIGKVKLGQAATVTVSATGDELSGHVQSISLLPSSSSGSATSAVSYPVTIVLDQSAPKVRSGMSASASIVTSQVSGLAIPSQAISGGTVTVVRGGKNVSEAVQTGVVGDSTTQVVSGLKTGDTIVVRSPTATATLSSSATGTDAATGALGGPGGAGGFGGAAGAGGGRFSRLRALGGG